MKQLFYLILSLLFIGVGFSQVQTIQRDHTGAVPAAYFQDGLFYNVNQTNPLPVAIYAPGSSSTNFYSESKTSIAGVDSIEFGFTTRNITIINDASATDTLLVSPEITFPVNKTIYRIGGEGLSYPIAVSKLYYKYGFSGEVGKIFRVEAY